jgi:hypothetical protein
MNGPGSIDGIDSLSHYTFLLQNIVDGIFNSIDNLPGTHKFGQNRKKIMKIKSR